MSTLLGTAHIGWMRTVQERALPGTVIIQRRTDVRGVMGGFTESWAAIGTVDGRLAFQNSASQSEPATGERPSSMSMWFVTMPVGTDVTAEDRLSVGGRTFEVLRVNNDQDWKTAVRCECISINEEARA